MSFSVATNRVWYDQNRQKQEATDYHNIVSFGKQAETIAQYMKKGSSIYVEGRLQTRSWDQDGKKQYRTEILAEKFQFGPRAGGAPGASSSPVSSSNNAGGAEEQEPPMIDSVDYPEEDINPEDIPF